MLDKILYTFFGWLDTFSEHLDKVFFPKPKKRKKENVKIVNASVIVKKFYIVIFTMANYVLVRFANARS